MNVIGITGQARSGKDTVADRLVQNHGYVKIALADPLKRLGSQVFGFTEDQLWGPSELRNAHDRRYDYYGHVRVNGKFTIDMGLAPLRGVCDPGWYAAAQAFQTYARDWLEDVLPGYTKQQEKTLCQWFGMLGYQYPQLSPRVMLQLLGTEWGRLAADENIWVNYMLRNAALVLDGHGYDRRLGILPKTDIIPKGVVVSDVRFQNELQAIQTAEGKLVRVKRTATDGDAATTGVKAHASEMEQQSFKDKDFNVVLRNNGTLEELYAAIDKATGKL